MPNRRDSSSSERRQAFDILLPYVKRALDQADHDEGLSVQEAFDLLSAFALLTGLERGWVGQRLLALRLEQQMPKPEDEGREPLVLSEDGLPRAETAALLDLAGGLTVEQSARKRNVGVETAKTYRARVSQRLGARNGPHAVSLAYDLGLLPELTAEEPPD